MQVVLKSGATKKEIRKLEEIFFTRRISGGFNAKKYNGIMPMKDDALAIQKELRDEWDR